MLDFSLHIIKHTRSHSPSSGYNRFALFVDELQYVSQFESQSLIIPNDRRYPACLHSSLPPGMIHFKKSHFSVYFCICSSKSQKPLSPSPPKSPPLSPSPPLYPPPPLPPLTDPPSDIPFPYSSHGTLSSAQIQYGNITFALTA
jgi:hypothetical protein